MNKLAITASFAGNSQLYVSWPTAGLDRPERYWIAVRDECGRQEWIIDAAATRLEDGLRSSKVQLNLTEIFGSSCSYNVSVKGGTSTITGAGGVSAAYQVVVSGSQSAAVSATSDAGETTTGPVSPAASAKSGFRKYYVCRRTRLCYRPPVARRPASILTRRRTRPNRRLIFSYNTRRILYRSLSKAAAKHESVTQLNVNSTVHGESQLNAAISWSSCGWTQTPDKWQVSVKNLTWLQNDYWYHQWIFDVDVSAESFQVPLEFRPGNRYRVTLRGLRQRSSIVAMTSDVAGAAAETTTFDVLLKGSTEFRTGEVMEMSELFSHMKKAMTSSSPSDTSKCRWFYRNKSEQYFSNITSKHGGVMKTYLKDASGDPRSPINGEINGLFFMSKVQDGQPQAQSPFGNTRLLVRADILLGLAPNVYFADFYCLEFSSLSSRSRGSGSRRGSRSRQRKEKDHYITLVQTCHGSDADRICQQRLPKLNIYNKNDSPFLYFESGEVRVSSTFMVELFFTEDLQVAQLLEDGKAQMKYNIPTFGAGQTSQGGRAKHSSCAICRTRQNAMSDAWTPLDEF